MKERYCQRLQNVKDVMQEKDIKLWIISDRANLFYLTGIEVSKGVLLLSKYEECVFVDSRYYEEVSSNCHCQIMLYENENFVNFLSKVCAIKDKKLSWGFEKKKFSYNEYLFWSKLLEEIGDFDLCDEESILDDIRMIKDSSEIEMLKNAAELNEKGLRHVLSLVEEGISERSLAMKLEVFWKINCNADVSFPVNVSFGKNSAVPHHKVSDDCLQHGDVILLDIGVKFCGYNSDMTRTLFWGRNEKMMNAYNVLKEAQEQALQMCKPGVASMDLDVLAKNKIGDGGFSEYCYSHGLGHGIGVEIHEHPNLKYNKKDVKLKKNMVFTIEPGIYIPGVGGIRIEDTIIVTKDGYENLCKYSKEPIMLKK